MNNNIQKYTTYKPSGVEWLGEIPEHWEVKKLKYLLNGKLKYGANESGIEYDISLPRYVRITDFGFNGRLSEASKLSLSWQQGGNYLLKDGDILFARSGATVGKTYQFKKSMSIESNYCYAGYLIKALDHKETMIDPQNSNPRGVSGGQDEDPLDLIIKSFNEKWFQGWNATPEEQRVKFVSIARFVREHPNFNSHYVNNPDVHTRDLALARIISEAISKQRKSELELYKLFVNDGAFKTAFEDSIRRMVGVR